MVLTTAPTALFPLQIKRLKLAYTHVERVTAAAAPEPHRPARQPLFLLESRVVSDSYCSFPLAQSYCHLIHRMGVIKVDDISR